MLKKGDDLIVGNEMMDKTTNRAYLASATALVQILLRRTSDMLETLNIYEIFKSKFIKRVKGRIRDGKSERAECQWGDRGIQLFQECCSDVWALHKV